MEEKARVESILQDVRHYIETRWNLLVLNTSDKASDVISSIASIMLIAVSMIFVLLFLSIGAAIWIGHSFSDTSMGFLIVGLFYLVVSIILFTVRNSLIKLPLVNKLINSFYADEKD